MSIDTAPPTAAHFRVEADTADLLFRQARTTRAFTDDEVPAEQIRAVYDLIKYGPTAMNAVPMRLLVVRSAEARERLAQHMAGGNKDRVSAAPLSIVVAYDPAFHEYMDRLFPQAPGVREHLAGQADQRAAMARDNTLLQAGYLVVGLRAAGLGVGPMTGMDADAIDAEFFAENGWRSLMVVNVGRPAQSDESGSRGERLAFDEVAHTI
ncbi:malonic semialdehyde reductase [Ruania suaedae]|uniref:malonic semialdehyde reductase n=1 Tax=Ruania suaedae TaxID=2897774 RepID=UPI001E502D05|nr:malonic semialdehyde reductase [Ruania suaedae]UFU03947.1 malonic semialdehyde reductase [Ruania suaedae]